MAYVGVSPFERVEEFTRGGTEWKLVLGVNEEGEGFIFFEERVLFKGAIQLRWVPVRVTFEFERGVNTIIESYWRQEKYIDGEFIEGTEGPLVHMVTNLPDKIKFTPQLGVPILFSMAGGFVRQVLGFDDQPLFTNGTRIPDTEYDVTLPPINTYDSHLPEVINETTI